MDTENALIQYLYTNIGEAMQPWREYDDIYGVWVYMNSDHTNLAGISYLRQSLQTPEGLRAWGGAIWFGFDDGILELQLCDDGITDEDAYKEYLAETGDWDEEEQKDDTREVPDPVGTALRDAFFAELKQQPGYVPWDSGKPPYRFSDFPEKLAFIRVCGEAIKLLHENGVIAYACGKPVPVGITYFHDSDREMVQFATSVAENSNPPSLADDMLAYQRRAGI